MPILVIEGPDESGKTTLAQMIYQQLKESGFTGAEYQRSPVKEYGWSFQYNRYLSNLIQAAEGHLIIQDRIPEISESVYGILRGQPRNAGYTYELWNWLGNNVFMVFCQGGITEEDHRDAIGRRLKPADHRRAADLYRLVYHEIRHASIYGSAPMKVYTYNRNSKASWLSLMFYIREWMIYAFADQVPAVNQALTFDLDSVFPMPEMPEQGEPPL